jgi:hypothetical protein
MSSTSSTYHRDGTVTLWDVYCQRWRRLPAANVTDQILATLSDRDRQLIKRMAVRAKGDQAPILSEDFARRACDGCERE